MRFRTPFTVLCLTVFPAIAQEAPPLTPLSIEAMRLDTIRNLDVDVGSPCCAPEVLESGSETDFLYLSIVFDVAWSDNVDKVRVSGYDSIFLKFPGQTTPEEMSAPWGLIDWYPEVKIRVPNIDQSRPRKWPDVDEDAHLNALFTIPAAATEAVLVLGKTDEPQLEVAIDLSSPATELPSSSSFFDVTVDDLSVVTEIATERKLRNGVIGGSIRAAQGQILALSVTINPKQNLKVDSAPLANSFAYNTRSFMVTGPEGLLLLPMGQDREGQVGNSVPNTMNWSGEGATGVTSDTFYFLGSGASGDYQIYMNEDVVATATLN